MIYPLNWWPVGGIKFMKIMPTKQKHQVKSRWYYIFWGAATVSVFAGQIYVGSGYRQMSESFNRIVDTLIIEVERNFEYDRQKFY